MLKANITRAVTLMLMLSCCLALAQAQASDKRERRSRPAVGRVEVKTTPIGYPLIIDGKPAGVTYDPAQPVELTPGKHIVEVVFPDKRWSQEIDVIAGRRHCICLKYVTRTVNKPCPYPVSVSAPSVINDGDVITFTSDVAYGGNSSALNYTWTITPSSARTLSGANTPSITVDSTGLGRQQIRAVLVVDDGSGDPTCRQTAEAAVNVTALPMPAPPREFDEFPNLAFDDVKARLDNFAVELQNAPGAQGYIIVYGGRTSRAGQADRLGERAREYLVNRRGISASRLAVINGGYRERDSYELWIVPRGAEPPRATPTLQPSEIRPGRETGTRRTRRRD